MKLIFWAVLLLFIFLSVLSIIFLGLFLKKRGQKRKYLVNERRKVENEGMRIWIADKKYWEKFDELIAEIIGLLVEISSKHLKDGKKIRRMFLSVDEEKRWECLVTGGIWSDTYLGLMKIFEAGIPKEIFSQLEKANQSAANASADGYARDGESLSLCERRRKESIEKLEKAVANLKKVSSKTENTKQISLPAD